MTKVDIFETSEIMQYGRKLIFINAKFPNLDPILLPEVGIKIYSLCNIFPTVGFGINIQIGAYTEIGNRVQIGDNVRIGAMCFIPEGVIIHSNVWIGPGCKFSNDMYPPSPRENWQKTYIKKGARLGTGVLVRPGVTIGEGSLVGMGAVVTKDIGDNEVWSGNPAKFMRKLND